MWNDKVSPEGKFSMLPSSENSDLVEVDSRVWSLTTNLLYHVASRSSFVPEGMAGIGFGHRSVDIDDPVLGNVMTRVRRVWTTSRKRVTQIMHVARTVLRTRRRTCRADRCWEAACITM